MHINLLGQSPLMIGVRGFYEGQPSLNAPAAGMVI
jgi:hypothetical protein